MCWQLVWLGQCQQACNESAMFWEETGKKNGEVHRESSKTLCSRRELAIIEQYGSNRVEEVFTHICCAHGLYISVGATWGILQTILFDKHSQC